MFIKQISFHHQISVSDTKHFCFDNMVKNVYMKLNDDRINENGYDGYDFKAFYL